MISIGQGLVTQQKNPSNNNTNPVNPTPKSINQSQYHIVKPGESVEQLAGMYGYTVDRFRKMNGLGAFERIYNGQKVFTSDCDCPNTEGLPSDVVKPYDAVETERFTARGNPDVYFRPIKVHMVKGSETLFGIARQYDTTVDRVLELNGLDKNAKLAKDQRIYVQ